MLHRKAEDLTPLRARARRLLSVFPHPDDESYGPAGTLARAGADPDAAAVCLCLTHGEASSMGPERGLSTDAVAALREGRLVEVAGLLGLDGMIVASLPDGRLARCGLDEVAAVITAVLDAFQPQVVIGHDPRGVNAHPDHIATHWALRHALLGRKTRFAMMAYLDDVVEIAKPRLIFPTPEDEIDAVVHLSDDETRAKESCLRVHEAFITLVETSDPAMIQRPPIERYDFLGQPMSPPVDDLFAGLE